MRTLETRLARLEHNHNGPAGFELWIDDDTDMLGPNGESMSRAEFEACYPDAIAIGGPVEGASDENH